MNAQEAPAPPLRILSLDGGGIRGKSSLLILENIMEGIRKAKGLDLVPKPCDYFDLIGGTSTGGIIAIMLGRLSMSVDECIRAYDKVAERAFTPKRNSFPIAPPRGAYSAKALEAAIKQTVKDFCTEAPCAARRSQGHSTAETCSHEDLEFRSVSCTKTVVLAITKEDADTLPTLITTCDTSTHLQGCTIWEIARATSAATTFFKSIKLGRDQVEFIDAGFGHNNPCKVLINEARGQFPGRDSLQILSIGTGLGGVVTIKDSRRSIIKALTSMATTSNKIAADLDSQYDDSGQYHRFNVDHGLEDVTLSDWEKASKISAHTNNYLNKNQRAIKQFVDGFVGVSGGRERGGTTSIHTRFYVPFPRNKRFVGRGTILDTLRRMLFEDNCQQVALVGLGGIGKTQVALQLAYWTKVNKPEYSIFWVPAVSKATFEQAYTEMATELPIKKSGNEDTIELVRRFLNSNEAGKWLLIVDNADDMDLLYGPPDAVGIKQYLPESRDGLTLFTTRSREVAQSCSENDMIELPEMDLQEALGFLKKSLVEYDEEMAKELAHELAYLPLAIKQAIAYLNTTKLPIRQYLSRLRNTEQDMTVLMGKEFRDDFRYSTSQNAVATTWLVSFDQIRQSNDAAAKLLGFISRLEPKAIPQSILPTFQTRQQLEDAIDTLCIYNFLTRRYGYQTNQVFDMHRLVHLGARIWIQRHGLTSEITCDAIVHINGIFPSWHYTNRELWRTYLPHTLKVLHESSEHKFQDTFTLFKLVGHALQQDWRFKESIWLFEEAFQWAKELPENDKFRLSLEHGLANAYTDVGQTKEAIAIFEHVVRVRKNICLEIDGHRLASEHGLALAYLESGQPKEAMELLGRVVAIKKKIYAEDDERRLRSEIMLARAYREDGQIEEAIALFQYVVVARNVLPEDNFDRLHSEYGLASAYYEDGRIGEAICLFEHVVRVRKALPEDHRDRLAPEHALARAYLKDRRINDAIDLLHHVVRIHEEILDANHRDSIAAQYWLAHAYELLGKEH